MIAFTIHPIHRSGKGHYLQTNRVKHTSTDLALLKSLQVMSRFGGTCQEKGKKGLLPLPLTQNLYWEPTGWSHPPNSSFPGMSSVFPIPFTVPLHYQLWWASATSQDFIFRHHSPGEYSQDNRADLDPMARLLAWTSPGSCMAAPHADSAQPVQAQGKQREHWGTAGMKAVGCSFQKLHVGSTQQFS